MSLAFFKGKTITTLYLWGMLIIFLFVILFTSLIVYEEYNDFENETVTIRKQYIEEQKNTIRFDIDRVLKFIEHSYATWHGSMNEEKLKAQVIHAIEELYWRSDGTGYIFIYDFNVY